MEARALTAPETGEYYTRVPQGRRSTAHTSITTGYCASSQVVVSCPMQSMVRY
jgi:hypothetical protein